MNGMNLGKLGGFCALGNISEPDIEQLLFSAVCRSNIGNLEALIGKQRLERRVFGCMQVHRYIVRSLVVCAHSDTYVCLLSNVAIDSIDVCSTFMA